MMMPKKHTSKRFRIQHAGQSRVLGLDLTTIPFSSVFSDHMLVVEYADGFWKDPTIQPYGPLPLHPNISALQYGVSVFEGLKAHRAEDDRILLFRPHENARRMNRSAARLAMPVVPETLFITGLEELLRVDAAWVPPWRAGALYIRPCLFSIDGCVRPRPADRLLFVIFTLPFGSYYAAPVDVLVTEQYVRAFPGGTGDVKPAGNYAPCLIADKEAQARGFGTVMWLDGHNRKYVEECGVMNMFFVVQQKSGRCVITPDLSGTILPGITRDSVIQLLQDMGIAIEERRIAIDEVLAWHRAGQLLECFGVGTAASISHISRIRYREDDVVLPPIEQRRVGPDVRERLAAIVTGDAPDMHNWIYEIKQDVNRASPEMVVAATVGEQL
jgi:branched-chain amino acid aminotransferase